MAAYVCTFTGATVDSSGSSATQFKTNNSYGYERIHELTQNSSVAWLSGFSFSIGAMSPNVTEQTEGYLLFQARFSDSDTWTTFARGDKNITNDNGRSVPYAWFYQNAVYGMRYLFYGDRLINNNNILYKIVKNSSKLQLRCVFNNKNNKAVGCKWGNGSGIQSAIKMKFYLQTLDKPSESLVESDYATRIDSNNVFISPERESVPFAINFRDLTNPMCLPTYTSYEWQYKKDSEDSWITDPDSITYPPAKSAYGGGNISRTTSTVAWNAAVMDLLEPPTLTTKSAVFFSSPSKTVLPLLNQEQYHYRIVFNSKSGDPEGCKQILNIPSITCSYNRLDMTNLTVIPINTKSNTSIILGAEGQTNLTIPISITETLSLAPTDKGSFYFNHNKLKAQVSFFDSEDGQVNAPQDYSYSFLNNTNEMFLTFPSGVPAEINKIKFTFTETYPSQGEVIQEQNRTIEVNYIPSGKIEPSSLICSPGIIENNSISFYSATNLQYARVGDFSIIELSNDSPTLTITNVSSNTKKLEWNNSYSENTKILISSDTTGDYGTYTSLIPLELTVFKTNSLNGVDVYYKDSNSDIGEEKWGETTLPFRFYDNITLLFTNNDDNLVTYNLTAINENGSILGLGQGLTTIVDGQHQISILVNEHELLNNVNTRLELILTDVYGQQIIKTGLSVGQLRPVIFSATLDNIDSTSLKTSLLFTDVATIEGNPDLYLRGNIHHKLEQAAEHYCSLSTSEEGIQITLQEGNALGQKQFVKEFTDLDYVNNSSKLITDLTACINNSPAILTLTVYHKNFPHCAYSYIINNCKYNFTRELNLELANIDWALSEEWKHNYINGGQNVNFYIADNGYKNNKGRFISNGNYQYLQYYTPPIYYTVAFKDNENNIQNTFDESKDQELTIPARFPYAETDQKQAVALYIKIQNQESSFMNNKVSEDHEYDVARWSATPALPEINGLTYNFEDNSIITTLILDEFNNGSNKWNNYETPLVKIYDQSDPSFSKSLYLWEDGSWRDTEVATYSLLKRSATNSEFFNFVVKVTYTNSAGDTITVESESYLVSKLIDLTIRRGRVGINVKQTFEYENEENNLPTLEVHQKTTTQNNQTEIIKLVGSNNNGLGPAIGFYDENDKCYGHIYGGLQDALSSMKIMTEAEVEAIFTGGDAK